MKTKSTNIIKYVFITLMAGILFFSCHDFLAENPTGSLTDEAQITSIPGGIALATGAYRALPDWTGGGGAWGATFRLVWNTPPEKHTLSIWVPIFGNMKLIL